MRSRFKSPIVFTVMMTMTMGLAGQSSCYAQSILNRLFGGKPAPVAQQPFAGHALLAQALQAAEDGDIEKSLRLAREAFQSGGSHEFNHPETQRIGLTTLQLVQAWSDKNAHSDAVTEVLLDVVLPAKSPGEAFPYPEQWQLFYDSMVFSRPGTRLLAPRSVSAELVRSALLAGKSAEVRERLKPALSSKTRAWVARVVAVQLSAAKRDSEATNSYLAELAKDVAMIDSPQAPEFMCHAVIAAIRDPKSEVAGLSLLEAILDRAASSPDQPSTLRWNVPWLKIHAARRHAQSGRKDETLRQIKGVVDQPMKTRFGNDDFNVMLRNVSLEHAAAALLECGLVAEALEVLVPLAEDPEPRPNPYFNRLNVGAMVGRELQKLAAQKRFDLLRAWTIHRGDRPALRDLTGFVPSDIPLGQKPDSLPRTGLLRDVYGTGWHLLATAKELGKLDELMQDLAVIPQQSPRVEALRVLGAVLRDGSQDNKAVTPRRLDETTVRLLKFLETTSQTRAKWEDQNKLPFPKLTYLVAMEAGRNPEWRVVARNLVEQLIEHSKVLQWDRERSHVNMALMELWRLSSDGNSRKTSADEWAPMHPRHWIESGSESGEHHGYGGLPGTWYALDGTMQHLASPFEAALTFETPLTGQFQIDFDARQGGWLEGNVGYGGVYCLVEGYANTARLIGRGRSGFEAGPGFAIPIHKEDWTHYTLQVNGDSVRFRANGQVVHADKPGSSAPWFTVGTNRGCMTIVRNFKMTGTPTIPSEIPLLTDPSLRGWLASQYDESRRDPMRDYLREVQGQAATNMPPQSEPETDWKFEKGELTSPCRSAFSPGGIESCLYYQTPLREGDTLGYEFFHEAGKTEAAPTIGRIAYQFGLEGVTRHWLTDGLCEVFAIPADNGVLEKKKLSLKEGDWNVVQVQLRGGNLSITLNGREAVTEPLPKRGNRAFGFYHDAAQASLRVRNAVLTGDWPKKWTQAAQQAFEWPRPGEPFPNVRFPGYVNNEERYSDNAFAIYERALKLDAPARYEFLHQWVMPNSSHDLMRLAGAFTPTHPAPPVADQHPIDAAVTAARQACDSRMIQAGGNFVCPAILLVLAAKEADQLQALIKEVASHPSKSSPDMARSRAAMLGIIALLDDRPEDANASLWECHSLVTNDAGGMYSRWGAVALASLAVQHPATREAAYYLLDRIQTSHLQQGKPGSPEFSRFVRQLHGQVHYLMYGGETEEFGTQPKTKQWRSAARVNARSRGLGYPTASFDNLTGELALRGGHEVDVAYFQSPLKGDFEVNARLSLNDFREMQLQVAGLATTLNVAGQRASVRDIQTALPDVPLPQPIPVAFQGWWDYKVVVKNGHYTSFINGQKLYESDVTTEHDPWVALLGIAGHSYRAARNVVITGQPQIPKELNLLDPPQMNGWLIDYYGNAVGQSAYPWKQEDGVLMSEQSHIRNEVPGRMKFESIIQYHRPILEDGEIQYEFYYDPETKAVVEDPTRRRFVNGVMQNSQQTVTGQTIVHPALDRMVCLLDPTGVKIHWLTDGRFDRSGLFPDNLEAVSESDEKLHRDSGKKATSRLSLKPNDWNAVTFAIHGDTLTITLNNEKILTRPIEPTNLRQFGLFHYVNESNVRVRNIVYRGEWPKTLPPVNEQDLARGPEQFAEIPDADLPESKAWDFTDSKFDADDFAYHWDAGAASKQIRPTEKGLKFELPAGFTKTNTVGLHPRTNLIGDFVATLEYSDMKTVPPTKPWAAAGLSFKVFSSDQYDAGLETRQYPSFQVTRATWQRFSPLQQYIFASESQSNYPESGQLRLVRRGSVLYYFTANTDSTDFRLLTHRPISADDDKQLNIAADAADASGGVEFVIKSLKIQAAKFRK